MTPAKLPPLEIALAQRDQALRFLSHDMRTPVASILALAEQLSRLLQGDQAQLQKVQRLSEHAQELMRQMDGFSMQSRALNEVLQFSERLVDDLVEEAVAQAQASANQKGMRLLVSASKDFFFVQAATQLMVRALFNMLANAVHLGKMGTPIQLQVRQADAASEPFVELIVIYQVALIAPDANKGQGDGLGWGLDLAEIVAGRHGGTLRRETLPGGVSRLVLSLPCVVEAES